MSALEGKRRVLGDEHPSTLRSVFKLAALAAVRGDRSTSLMWLRQAVDGGLTDVKAMVDNPDLESLHGDPEFEAVVTEVKKRTKAE